VTAATVISSPVWGASPDDRGLPARRGRRRRAEWSRHRHGRGRPRGAAPSSPCCSSPTALLPGRGRSWGPSTPDGRAHG